MAQGFRTIHPLAEAPPPAPEFTLNGSPSPISAIRAVTFEAVTFEPEFLQTNFQTPICWIWKTPLPLKLGHLHRVFPEVLQASDKGSRWEPLLGAEDHTSHTGTPQRSLHHSKAGPSSFSSSKTINSSHCHRIKTKSAWNSNFQDRLSPDHSSHNSFALFTK